MQKNVLKVAPMAAALAVSGSWFGSVPQSSGVDARAFVQGTIRGPGGELIKSGEVSIIVEPDGAPLARGESIGVEGVRVGPDGAYAVSAGQLNNMPSTSGIVSVTVVAMDESHNTGVEVVSMDWDAEERTLSPRIAFSALDGAGEQGPRSGADPVPRRGTVSPDARRINLPLKLTRVKRAGSADNLRAGGRGCGEYVVRTFTAPMVVGEFYSTTGGYIADWTAARGSVVEANAAIKLPNAPWKVGGRLEKTMTTDLFIEGMEGSKRQHMIGRVQMEEVEHWNCKDSWLTHTSLRPTFWTADLSVRYVPVPQTNSTQCSRITSRNGGARLDSTRATYFTNSIDTSGKIGIDLGSRTGWSQANTLKFLNKPTNTKGVTVCGLGGLPGSPTVRAFVVKP